MMGLDNPAFQFQDISYSIEEKRSNGSIDKSPKKTRKPPKAEELIKLVHFEPPIERSVWFTIFTFNYFNIIYDLFSWHSNSGKISTNQYLIN